MKLDDYKICCLCGLSFLGYGHNAEPLKEGGICCDVCNETKVIPARLKLLGVKCPT